MIGQTVSHYRILEALGRGGMGVVYEAEDARLRRRVALKFLSDELSRDPGAVERFQREARAASALNHPNICTVYDIGEHAGRHFIVMELLKGAPLQEYAAGVPMAPLRVLDLGTQLADALDAAHRSGIIHRDVKPANVFVTERGQAKLLDFGLAKSAIGQSKDTTITTAELTGAGSVLGTVAYMSPEQVRGEPLDTRTDLFSLGAVLHEMATACRPFQGATAGTIYDAILNRTPVPVNEAVTGTPAGLAGAISKALEKDRDLRYQSASELRADLQRTRRDIESAAGHPPAGGADRRTGWRRRAMFAAAVVILAVAAAAIGRSFLLSTADAIGSVAVLPFVNATGNPDNEYLSEGITESLINHLSQLQSLRVTAASTIFRYKGKTSDPRKIGQDLHVRAVLSGRLLLQGEMLVVRTELMDVANETQLWGGQYTRRAADLVSLQDELSGEISDRLRLRLTTDDKRRLARRDTDSASAYQSYLKGRYFWNKRNVEDLPKAIEHFNAAVDADPTYALAYAGLADTYSQMSFFNAVPPRDAMPKAKAAATRALEIDSGLAEAHISLAYASFTFDWDWPAAIRHFDQALALNRAAVMNHAYYPFYLTVAGQHDEAVNVARAALERDPPSASFSHTLAVQLLLARRFDEALAEGRRTVDVDPRFAVAHDVLAATLAAQGRFHDALSEAEKAVELSPISAPFRADLGYVQGRLGNRSAARRMLADLSAEAARRYTPAFAFALVHTGLDEPDEALTWLEKAYEERHNRLAYLQYEPVWDSLRADARFKDLVRRIGLPPARSVR